MQEPLHRAETAEPLSADVFMTFAGRALLALALLAPLPGLACMDVGPRERHPNVRLYPIAGDSIAHWPAQMDAQIGSITSLLVPLGAEVTLHHVRRGSIAPLTIFGPESHEQMRVSKDLSPPWTDLAFDAKKFRWVHIYASSFGVSEIRIRSRAGKAELKTMTVNLVYPSPLEQAQRPPVAVSVGSNEAAVVQVDARDQIEVTAPGSVDDGWRVSPEADTGFRLVRVERLERAYGEPPAVRLLFASTRNPRNAMMVLRREGASFQFQIIARPTPTC